MHAWSVLVPADANEVAEEPVHRLVQTRTRKSEHLPASVLSNGDGPTSNAGGIRVRCKCLLCTIFGMGVQMICINRDGLRAVRSLLFVGLFPIGLAMTAATPTLAGSGGFNNTGA